VCSITYKLYHSLRRPTQKPQHETVANIQDTQVVNLWSNDHVLSYELAGSVKPRPIVTLDGWPTSWVVEYIRTDQQSIQRKTCKNHKSSLL